MKIPFEINESKSVQTLNQSDLNINFENIEIDIVTGKFDVYDCSFRNGKLITYTENSEEAGKLSKETTFVNCNFDNFDFKGSRLSRIFPLPVVESSFKNCTFKDSQMHNVNYQNGIFENCKFENIIFGIFRKNPTQRRIKQILSETSQLFDEETSLNYAEKIFIQEQIKQDLKTKELGFIDKAFKNCEFKNCTFFFYIYSRTNFKLCF